MPKPTPWRGRGRPRVSDETRIQIGFRLPESIHRRLVAEAARRGRSANQVVVEVLDATLPTS